MAKALVVLAHPLATSLCGHFAGIAIETLRQRGHEVVLLDLAREGFDPRLTEAERRSYYAAEYDSSGIAREAALLADAETLVLVFPTWWFSPPALMKGFMDRVFAPGVAFDHSPGFGPIRPRLATLRHAVVITTTGSPWWVDRFVMRRPVRRILKWGLVKASAPHARFAYLPFHAAESPTPDRIARFRKRIAAVFAR